jgi:hypothetical protein
VKKSNFQKFGIQEVEPSQVILSDVNEEMLAVGKFDLILICFNFHILLQVEREQKSWDIWKWKIRR